LLSVLIAVHARKICAGKARCSSEYDVIHICAVHEKVYFKHSAYNNRGVIIPYRKKGNTEAQVCSKRAASEGRD
jgi:hypothetical protein